MFVLRCTITVHIGFQRFSVKKRNSYLIDIFHIHYVLAWYCVSPVLSKIHYWNSTWFYLFLKKVIIRRFYITCVACISSVGQWWSRILIPDQVLRMLIGEVQGYTKASGLLDSRGFSELVICCGSWLALRKSAQLQPFLQVFNQAWFTYYELQIFKVHNLRNFGICVPSGNHC